MDVVEAGREREPVSRWRLAAAAAVLLPLAAAGTWRAIDADPVARRRLAPSPTVSVPPLETVDPERIPAFPGPPPIQAPVPYEGDPLDLVFVSQSAVRHATTADTVQETWLAAPAGYDIRTSVRLRDGVAAVAHPVEFGEKAPSRLLVRSGAYEVSFTLPGPQRIVPGETDMDFWTVDWLGTKAQRRDAEGRPAGRPVPLPEQTELVRVLRGGLMLVSLQTYQPGIAVWDPAGRRYVRTLSKAGGVITAAAHAVVWTDHCRSEPCPVRVADVRTWRVRDVPTPGPGHFEGAVLDATGTNLAFGWAGGHDTVDVYVVPAGGDDAMAVVAEEVSGHVLLDWVDDRLVIAQTLFGSTVMAVWGYDTGLRGGFAYDGLQGDTQAFYAGA